MAKKTEEKPIEEIEVKKNLYQRLFECSKKLVGLKKITKPGIHGEFWDADHICLAVRDAMNEFEIIHKFEIMKTDIISNQANDKLLLSVEVLFTYINIDNPEEKESEILCFKDIQTVKLLNLNSIISKARKAHYVGKFNIAANEDTETPFDDKSKTKTTQQQQPANYQNFSPEWKFTFGEHKGVMLKDVPTASLLGLLNSEKTFPKLKVAIRYFLKSKGIECGNNNEVHKQ